MGRLDNKGIATPCGSFGEDENSRWEYLRRWAESSMMPSTRWGMLYLPLSLTQGFLFWVQEVSSTKWQPTAVQHLFMLNSKWLLAHIINTITSEIPRNFLALKCQRCLHFSLHSVTAGEKGKKARKKSEERTGRWSPGCRRYCVWPRHCRPTECGDLWWESQSNVTLNFSSQMGVWCNHRARGTGREFALHPR